MLYSIYLGWVGELSNQYNTTARLLLYKEYAIKIGQILKGQTVKFKTREYVADNCAIAAVLYAFTVGCSTQDEENQPENKM